MHSVAVQFAAGKTFFVGVALVAAACLLRYAGCGRRGVGAPLTLAAFTGWLLVLLSATPLPAWAYAVWSLALTLAIACAERPGWSRGKAHRVALGALLLVSVAMVAVELPWHRRRPLPFPRDVPVFVIGDSLAMALEDGVAPWPRQWAERSGLQVTSLAAGGKRTEGALSDLLRIPPGPASVLLEIGGNDLLGGTPTPEFAQTLATLLDRVCQPGRAVALLELPLTPFGNGYGRAQREPAVRHGVTLIPKRCLADILADPKATVDGIHLSGRGHARLATLLADLTPAP